MSQHDYAAIALVINSSPAYCGTTRVIAIDGPAGSGKTTLAAGISRMLNDCQVIHMDDLYDGWSQDLEVELGTRINMRILEPLSRSEFGKYENFDWHAQKFTSSTDVYPKDFLILEGVGASNQISAPYVSINIWIAANPNVVVERIVSRDGEAVRPELSEWQRRELAYFESQQIKQRAHLQLSGD